MTHHLPLFAMLLLALAASTLLSRTPVPRPALALAAATQDAPATPYGSGAAMRSLLF